MWGLIICGIIFVFLFWYAAIRPLNYWKIRGVKQGNPTWLIGDSLSTLLRTESISELIIRCYNLAPGERYVGFYQFTTPTLIIRDPDLLKQVTVKEFDHFVDHPDFVPDDVDPYWSKNLFASKGQRWREMRPILSPCFTSSKMRSMFVLMSDCVELFIDHFLKKNEDVVEVQMKDIFTRFANDIIASTAFGVTVNSLEQPNNQFYIMGKEATNFSGFWNTMKFFSYFVVPSLSKLFSLTVFSEEVSNFFQSIVDENIKIREEKGIIKPDMIHLLMEAKKGNNKHEEKNLGDAGFATVEEADIGKVDASSKSKEITNVDIAAQALVFFIAGFDAVTNLMSFMAYELAINPDIQDRLREEILETKQNCEGNLNYEALMTMKYMDMVVTEILRKWPNNPVIERLCTKSYTIQPQQPNETPIHIEKDFTLWIPIIGIHRDPNYYPDPEKFDPERFSDDNKNNIKPFTYLPFGLGPRNCIGSRFALMETKILFFYLLENFEIVPTNQSTIPVKIHKNSFTLTAEDGFRLGLKLLNKR